jgi:hypothetical protein
LSLFVDGLVSDEVLCATLELDPLEATTYISSLLVANDMKEIGWDGLVQCILADMSQSPGTF